MHSHAPASPIYACAGSCCRRDSIAHTRHCTRSTPSSAHLQRQRLSPGSHGCDHPCIWAQQGKQTSTTSHTPHAQGTRGVRPTQPTKQANHTRSLTHTRKRAFPLTHSKKQTSSTPSHYCCCGPGGGWPRSFMLLPNFIFSFLPPPPPAVAAVPTVPAEFDGPPCHEALGAGPPAYPAPLAAAAAPAPELCTAL